MSKRPGARLEELPARARAIVEEAAAGSGRAQPAAGRERALAALCEALAEVEGLDWVGFYLADAGSRMLLLGAYVGEATEHVRIPYGRGICGQAAVRGETFVVADVALEDNYLACSPRVQSEIVIPVFRDGRLAAELDIDSHTAGFFTEGHRRVLEQVAGIAAALF